MVDLRYYINAIKNEEKVSCLQERRVKDDLAEVATITRAWLHESGVIIRYINELEEIQPAAEVCPECWICWEVIEAAGQDIRPMKKQFHNVCQESFWLKMT
ncbi:hypothetical protein CJP72_04320 [Citrobacter sp. NCU1]|nr:hypothetical protein [Citrobacter sp. NCU1]